MTMAGIGCLLGALAFWVTSPGAGDSGYGPKGRGGDGPAAAPAPTGGKGPGRGGGGDGRAADTAPTGVKLPGRDGRVHVVPIGVARSGTLEPPAEVSDAGWWRGGAALGDTAGAVVLAGPVEGAAAGTGRFASLR